MSAKHNGMQKILDYLMARPNIYVDYAVLERLGGRGGWRTRLSEGRCKLLAEGIGDPIDPIQNRQRRMKDADGNEWRLSEYAFVPATPAEDWQPVHLDTAQQVGLL